MQISGASNLILRIVITISHNNSHYPAWNVVHTAEIEVHAIGATEFRLKLDNGEALGSNRAVYGPKPPITSVRRLIGQDYHRLVAHYFIPSTLG